MRRDTDPRWLIRPTAKRSFLAIALLFVVAACSAAAPGTEGPGASPDPTIAPTEAPTGAPAPTPSPVATPQGGPFVVDLVVADPHVVSVEIDDQTGEIDAASSGQPGDGMSVRWGDVLVENVDPTTISITWVGLPIDEALGMTVTRDGDRVLVDVEQDLPPANSDAMGADRVLVLTFGGPVAADDVEVTFPDFAAA